MGKYRDSHEIIERRMNRVEGSERMICVSERGGSFVNVRKDIGWR